MEDLYKTLDLCKSCSADDIRRSYQRLAKQYHPDKQSQELGDAEREDCVQRFHQILRAYEVLSDETLRREYDTKSNAVQLTQAWPINATVDLDEMSFDSATAEYSYACRCGGNYLITEGDLETGVDTVCCSTCTLSIKVLYQALEREEDEKS